MGLVVELIMAIKTQCDLSEKCGNTESTSKMLNINDSLFNCNRLNSFAENILSQSPRIRSDYHTVREMLKVIFMIGSPRIPRFSETIREFKSRS